MQTHLYLLCLVVVAADIFEEYYRCWKETEMECRRKSFPVSGDVTEYVLKMSDIVKCSHGVGRLGLTQHRCGNHELIRHFFLIIGIIQIAHYVTLI